MAKKTRQAATYPGTLNCACLIHGDLYDWQYVDKLYHMLCRHLSASVVLHVYTEHHRPVPEPYIKHPLIDWGISGPKRSWWYKMQLFNSDFYRGPLLYLDLDTVIVNNIDWIWKQGCNHLWTIRDFKYLWRPSLNNINSSVIWWDTTRFDHIWRDFQSRDLREIMRKYHGDQDYLTEAISPAQRRCFATDQVKSWRWECLDGGFDFRSRKYLDPGSGTNIPDTTSILIFHGHPKPDKVQDPYIQAHWC